MASSFATTTLPIPTSHLHSHHPRTSLAPPKCPNTIPFGIPQMSLASSSPEQRSDESRSTQIPKSEPFSRSRLSRRMREPSLLEKAEHTISDRCMALEGEEAYECWEALFDFEDIKEECKAQCDIAPSHERASACQPLERFENIVRQSNGVSSLISNVRMLARYRKQRKAKLEEQQHHEQAIRKAEKAEERRKAFPEPGGLPPTEEELEVERSALMPESTYTRLLRRRGTPASWYTHPPDHETD